MNPMNAYVVFQHDNPLMVVLDTRRRAEFYRDQLRDQDKQDHGQDQGKGYHVIKVPVRT